MTAGGNAKESGVMLERALMGSVIMGDVLPSGLEIGEKDFGDPLCRRLFALTSEMERRGQQIDLAGVCMADETIDAEQIVDITQERCVSTVLVGQHAALLRGRGLRLRLGAIVAKAAAALQGGEDAAAVMERLHVEAGVELAESTGNTIGKDMMLAIIDVLEQMGRPQAREKLISTGIDRLDEHLVGGFRPGDLVVVAALTSVGKSAMLSFMMRSAAMQGKRILLVSCEMSDEQNAERYLASISGVNLSRIIRRDELTDEESQRISDGMTTYHPENIRLISSGTQTPASVRREALRMKAGGGLDMIVVDYLQRLRPDRNGQTKAEEVGAIASALKSLAVDLDVPVLTASQFNREAAKARREAEGKDEAGVPALHQMRDSSQIEDEANLVIVLDEPRRRPQSVRQINAHIVKNRSGDVGRIRLLFNAETMTYRAA